ncbi:hypothetical protein NESM_000330400 [Novymonas esmeraldas]|uniref:Uncharacterized protein n=1 Tax=Novymonas esmeraldas TaxID=1808958 RepID=A0AAW0EKH7_9TRYP
MKKRRAGVETYSVAARPHKPGGTDTTREHHFPVYSHPGFRAAQQNANDIRCAIEGQSDRIDPHALDAALEGVVAQLLEQQHQDQDQGQRDGLRRTQSGVAGPDASPDALVVTDEQLLALLAAATHATPPGQQQQQQQSSVYQPPCTTAVAMTSSGAAAVTAVTSAPSQQQRHFQPQQDYHLSHAALRPPSAEVERRAAPVARDRDAEPRELTVVSVSALQHTTLGGDGGGAEAALRLPPLSMSAIDSAASGEVVETKAPPRHNGVRSVARSRPPPTVSLYSLLPPVAASPESAPRSRPVMSTAALSSRISFSEMDRRPGMGAGPLAQQAVDPQQLHRVSPAVYAAMDVLMDGNSCCVRRRQRLPATNAATVGPLSVHHVRLHDGSGGGVGGAACFAFGCGGKGVSLSRAFVPAMQNTLPAPPAPRTAGEAKARRILEKERHRQRKYAAQQQPLLSSPSLLTTYTTTTGAAPPTSSSAAAAAAARSGPVTLPTEPLGSRLSRQRGSKLVEGSAAAASFPLISCGLSRASVAAGAAAGASATVPSRSPYTLRSIAGESVYTHAVDSANRFASSLF